MMFGSLRHKQPNTHLEPPLTSLLAIVVEEGKPEVASQSYRHSRCSVLQMFGAQLREEHCKGTEEPAPGIDALLPMEAQSTDSFILFSQHISNQYFLNVAICVDHIWSEGANKKKNR